jgi:putative ABC transport system permease protein
LPFKESDRLVVLWNEYKKMDLQASNSVPDYLDRRQQSQTLESVAALTPGSMNLTGKGEPVRVMGATVTASFFPTLGVEPVLGRAFTPEEDQPGRDRVVVLSHNAWQQRFGADPDIVGSEINLDGEDHTVLGVMPPDFHLIFLNVEVWKPIAFTPAQMSDDNRGSEYLVAIGRIKSGFTLEQVRAEMATIAARVIELFPDRGGFLVNAGWTATAVPLREQLFGDLRAPLLVLLSAVGLVLLIACANVANLLLARAQGREKEIAIRAALGAGRMRIVRQLLTESVLLALVGGALGVLLAFWTLRVLLTLAPTESQIPILAEIGISPPVLLFTLGLSLATGIVFGLVPAWTVARADLHESLKEGGRSTESGGRHRLRGALVVSEVALALVLLVGAGLLLRSVHGLLQVSPGFQPEQRLSFYTSLPASSYPDDARRIGFFRDLRPRIAALPGVRAAGAIHNVPFSGGNNTRSFRVEGYEAPEGESMPLCESRIITPGYMQAMGVRLQRGRDFEERDTAESPLVALVDEKTVRRFWPNQDPIGKRIGFGSAGAWREVVGVVGSVKNAGLEAEGREQIYVPYTQMPQPGMFVVVHTAGLPGSVTNAVRAEVKALDPNLPISDVKTMEQRLGDSIGVRRYAMFLLLGFSFIALLLAAVGIYGVISYSVSQRTHELGVRMALGAQPRDIFRLVVGQGMLLTSVGVGIGLLAAFGVTRLMSSLLFGVSAADPLTFGGVALVLAGVAVLGCYLPARRATRVDPMLALRYE